MEEFLKDVYRVARIRNELIDIIRYLHAVREVDVRLNLKDYLSDELVWLIETMLKIDHERATKFDKEIHMAFNRVGIDDGLAADIIQENIIPVIELWLKQMAQIEVDDDTSTWKFVSTRSGYLTLKNLKEGYYIHSLIDPMEEARDMAKCLYTPEITTYVILGGGLGYLPYQLNRLSEGSAKIVVFEKNQELIDYGYQFGVLGEIAENKLEVYKFDEVMEFLVYCRDNEEFYFINPNLINLEITEKEKEAFWDMFMDQNTTRNFGRRIEINYYRNRDNIKTRMTELEKIHDGKEFIVVAAGPSLDMCIEYLKEQQGKKVIVSVGTVFKKLLNAGITPDYVTVADPNRRTTLQFDGVMDKEVPMIMSAVAYWSFSEDYKGEKYLMYAMGSMDGLEEMAEKCGEPLFLAGGSVTSFGIETAVYMGASVVELVGADLAYPNGQSHTKGTIDYNEKKISGIEVECVDGGTVTTTIQMKSYLDDVEQQVSLHPEVVFKNKSKIGARIKGTIEE